VARPSREAVGLSGQTLRVYHFGQNLSQKYYYLGILESDGLWTLNFSVKAPKAKFLIFCNLIGENLID